MARLPFALAYPYGGGGSRWMSENPELAFALVLLAVLYGMYRYNKKDHR